MTVKLVSNQKIAETSSKGNQEKWLDHGRWYKLDQFGYEALAETVASMLLEHSNIERDTPFRFTRYRMERLLVHGRERTGCSSENFLHDGESIVTLSRLFRQYLGGSLSDALERLSSDKKRMAYLADATAELTELREFPQYLTLLFEIDALVLRPLREFCVSDFRQNQEYHVFNVHDEGLFPLSTFLPEGWDGMRAGTA